MPRPQMVEVTLRVTWPLNAAHKDLASKSFVAAVGTGFQLGNLDPDKGPRARQFGNNDWEKVIWFAKGTEVQLYWVRIGNTNNKVLAAETIAPRRVIIGIHRTIICTSYNERGFYIIETPKGKYKTPKKTFICSKPKPILYSEPKPKPEAVRQEKAKIADTSHSVQPRGKIQLEPQADKSGVTSQLELPEPQSDKCGITSQMELPEDKSGVTSQMELPEDKSGVPSQLELPEDKSGVTSQLELPEDKSGVTSQLELPEDKSGVTSQLELPDDKSGVTSQLELPEDKSGVTSQLELPEPQSDKSGVTSQLELPEPQSDKSDVTSQLELPEPHADKSGVTSQLELPEPQADKSGVTSQLELPEPHADKSGVTSQMGGEKPRPSALDNHKTPTQKMAKQVYNQEQDKDNLNELGDGDAVTTVFSKGDSDRIVVVEEVIGDTETVGSTQSSSAYKAALAATEMEDDTHIGGALIESFTKVAGFAGVCMVGNGLAKFFFGR